MITVFHPDELGHRVRTRLVGGNLADALEVPERVSALLDAAKTCTSGIVEPRPASLDIIRKVHDAAYLDFLENGFAA